MEKVAVYFGSREIYSDMATSCKSLLANTTIDKVYLLIEDDEFVEKLPHDVEVINIRDIVPQIFSKDSPNYNSNWTYIGLIRAALTKVFPQYDLILSIDCDTVVLEDIADLWELPMDDYYVAGVKEPIISMRRPPIYINAGVILLNLKKLREDHIDDEMIHDLNTQQHCFVAQDSLNRFCHGHILQIPGEYNTSTYTENGTEPYRVMHFAGGFPRGWRERADVKYYRDLSLGDIRQGRR